MREGSEVVSPLELVETSEEQNVSRKPMFFTGTRLKAIVMLTHVIYVLCMQKALTLLTLCEAHPLCGDHQSSWWKAFRSTVVFYAGIGWFLQIV